MARKNIKVINITTQETEKLISEFLKYYEYQNLSQATIKNYKVDLQQFSKWVQEKDVCHFDELTIKDFEKFLSQFKSASTINRKKSSLKMFYNFLLREEIVSENLVSAVKTVKNQVKRPDVITEIETRAIIHALEEENKQQNTLTSFRNLLILKMFLYTGIRREELTKIKLSDIAFDERAILINGKGNKQRTVFANTDLIQMFSKYCKMAKIKKSDTVIFDLSLVMINFIVNHAMEIANCKKDGRSCHTLRKRFASSAYKHSKDIYSVSKALGHEDLETIKRYAEVEKEQIKNTFAISY